MTRLFLMAMLAACALPGHAASSLVPYTATYKVKISVLSGELHTQLVAAGSGFEATHSIEATGMARVIAHGMIEESSRFDIVNGSVQPREYSSHDTMSSDETDANIEFDWDTGQAHGTVNGEEIVSDIEGMPLDRISIQYAVMLDLLNGRPGVQYTMFELDRLRPVEITIVEEKVVAVPAGKFRVIGIRHQAEGSKRASTLWCAPELGYLPVIIEQHRKGKLRVRATLETYTPLAAP